MVASNLFHLLEPFPVTAQLPFVHPSFSLLPMGPLCVGVAMHHVLSATTHLASHVRQSFRSGHVFAGQSDRGGVHLGPIGETEANWAGCRLFGRSHRDTKKNSWSELLGRLFYLFSAENCNHLILLDIFSSSLFPSRVINSVFSMLLRSKYVCIRW